MIIFANLDCEARWAGLTLPQHVRRRISAASVLLAAFAPEGEPVEIYAPAPVDPARVKIENVSMRVGTPDRYDLAWADPGAKAANDRRFALAIAAALPRELGVEFSSVALDSLAAIDDHIAQLGDRPWVCKATLTAAGRDRVFGRGPVGGEPRVYLGRLLERFGAVIFEPWVERVLDFGWCGHLSRDGANTGLGPHTLLADERGGFVGIDLAPPPLTGADHVALETLSAALGPALHRIGNAGSYTFDGFVYREGEQRRLRPMCELNARQSFGHVARALAQRLGTTRLGFGPPPPDARVLVAPSDDDSTCAWIR